MSGAQPLESNPQSATDRGAHPSVPRSTPLTIVSAAVAGDDLEALAASASDALGRPVAITLPGLGPTVLWPADASTPETLSKLAEHARAVIGGAASTGIEGVADSAPIRIGEQVVGVAAALGEIPLAIEGRAWLEGAATGAAVTALMRGASTGDVNASGSALLRALAACPPDDVSALLAQAQRLGVDLAGGAMAFCAQARNGAEPPQLPAIGSGLVAHVGGGRVLGLLPLARAEAAEAVVSADDLTAELGAVGMAVAHSAPRRSPDAFHEALREAELLLELAAHPDMLPAGQENTYRLLIGILLRNPEELRELRESTISALRDYDAEHDTELLATLQAFLDHDCSTTETAQAMHLHRHTVGYRLSRVHEVSGLSPYESDGRERLSLGLKAHHILEADRRPGVRQ